MRGPQGFCGQLCAALDFLQVPMEAYFLALSLVAPSHEDGPWDANASERRSLEIAAW